MQAEITAKMSASFWHEPTVETVQFSHSNTISKFSDILPEVV